MAIVAVNRLNSRRVRKRGSASIVFENAGRYNPEELLLMSLSECHMLTYLAGAMAIHEKAHANCFIANSVNFPVTHRAEIVEV